MFVELENYSIKCITGETWSRNHGKSCYYMQAALNVSLYVYDHGRLDKYK